MANTTKITGCLLARLLYRGGLHVSVFESEASPNFRSQGGTLDLHTKTGIAALKAADLFTEFQKHARYDGQYVAILDTDMTYQFKIDAEDKEAKIGARPEIDRAVLREMLYRSLPEGMVHWGHPVSRIEDQTLIFKDGTCSKEKFDLIVGADGAWSKVRQMIAPNLLPKYTGVSLFELSIPNAKVACPELHSLVNGGMVLVGAEGKRFTIQQMGGGSINCYSNMAKLEEDWAKPEKCGYDTSDLEATRAALLEEFKDFPPLIKSALQLTVKAGRRELYTLAPGEGWKHSSGVTLIGDAAHLMTPYAGEGVNQALSDAMLLSQVILRSIRNLKDINDDIESFEKDMIERTKSVQQLSLDLLNDWMFTPGTPKSIMSTIMTRHMNKDIPNIFHPLGKATVHSYFFFRNFRK